MDKEWQLVDVSYKACKARSNNAHWMAAVGAAQPAKHTDRCACPALSTIHNACCCCYPCSSSPELPKWWAAPCPFATPPAPPSLTRHGVAVLEHSMRQREQHVEQPPRSRRRQALGGGLCCLGCRNGQLRLLQPKLLLVGGGSLRNCRLHALQLAGRHLRAGGVGTRLRLEDRCATMLCPPLRAHGLSCHQPACYRLPCSAAAWPHPHSTPTT